LYETWQFVFKLNIKCLIFDIFLSVVLYNITVYAIVVTDNKINDREIYIIATQSRYFT